MNSDWDTVVDYPMFALDPELPAAIEPDDPHVGVDWPADGTGGPYGSNWNDAYIPKGTFTICSGGFNVKAKVVEPPNATGYLDIDKPLRNFPVGRKIKISLTGDEERFLKWSAPDTLLDGSDSRTDTVTLDSLPPAITPMVYHSHPFKVSGKMKAPVFSGPRKKFVSHTGDTYQVPEGTLVELAALPGEHEVFDYWGAYSTSSTEGPEDFPIYEGGPTVNPAYGIGAVIPAFSSTEFGFILPPRYGRCSVIASGGTVDFAGISLGGLGSGVLPGGCLVRMPYDKDSPCSGLVSFRVDPAVGFQVEGNDDGGCGALGVRQLDTGCSATVGVAVAQKAKLELKTDFDPNGGCAVPHEPSALGTIKPVPASAWYVRPTNCVQEPQRVFLTAAANYGYVFTRWKGKGIAYVDGVPKLLDDEEHPVTCTTIQVPMDDENEEITAYFCDCIHRGTTNKGFLQGDISLKNLPGGPYPITYGETPQYPLKNTFACEYYVLTKIKNVALAWAAVGANEHRGEKWSLLCINGISKPGGGQRVDSLPPFPNRGGHQNGLQVDVAYVGGSGWNLDETKSLALIRLFQGQGATRILIGPGTPFNDFAKYPDLKENGSDHDNHFHVDFPDPDGPDPDGKN